MGYHGKSVPPILSAPLTIFPAQQLVVLVVRDRIELSTFRFSGMGIIADQSMYRALACHLRAPSVLDHDGLGEPRGVAVIGQIGQR